MKNKKKHNQSPSIIERISKPVHSNLLATEHASLDLHVFLSLVLLSCVHAHTYTYIYTSPSISSSMYSFPTEQILFSCVFSSFFRVKTHAHTSKTACRKFFFSYEFLSVTFSSRLRSKTKKTQSQEISRDDSI